MPGDRVRVGPLVALVLVAGCVAGCRSAAAAKRPPACTQGRFLVRGASILTGAAEHDIEPVVLDGGRLAVGDACPPVRAKLKRTKRGTVVTVAWSRCERLTGRVRLVGTIEPTCSKLTGTLKARKSRVKRAFTAVVSTCGDGIGDAGNGEQCEPPGSPSCTLRCQTTGPSAPSITIGAPANLTLTAAPTVAVTGSVSASVTTVLCNTAAATVSGGSFSASVPLDEGHNTIVCVARAADAGAATASVNVSRDATGPRVGITTPKAAAVLGASPTTVAGFVNDLGAGDLLVAQPTVVCNGVAALVANRSFVASGITVAPGANAIACIATDLAGNRTTATIVVTLAPPAGPSIHRVSGDGQSGTIGTALAAPLVVALDDGAGQPVAGKTVVFRVTENDGTLDGGARAVMVDTGADGRAVARVTLGTRAGAGNQQVRATAVGFADEVLFTASAAAGTPARIVVDSGNLQEGLVGQPLPRPFVATVIDAGNNRLAGVPVTVAVEAGGGTLAASTVTTDVDGRAHAFLTLGPTPGRDGQVVSATFAGNPGAPVRFVATALAGGDPAATRISGVVLDGSNVPVPGVTVGIGNTSITTRSDAQGQFTIAPAPVGRVDLWVLGSTTSRPGAWPSLPYELVTVPGEDNTIGMPIYLPELDVAHGVQVDETHGGTVAPPDLPGFTLTIAPGSATFPDGTRRGLVTVTAVHPDKVPMIPQFGQQPRVIVTIQPAGTRFDPPAALTMPNADGLPPGQKTELYSFDHDLRSFLSIGTGTVSDDGSVIRSDPGVGVVKAGWHCGGNPSGIGTCEHECDDGDDCTDDQMAGGQCKHTPVADFPQQFCRDTKAPPPSCGGVTFTVDESCQGRCEQGRCVPQGDRQGLSNINAAIAGACDKIFGSSTCMPADVKKCIQDSIPKHVMIACTKSSSSTECGDGGGNTIKISDDPQSKCGQPDKTMRHELQHLGNVAPNSPCFRLTTHGGSSCATDRVYGCDVACYGSANCNGAVASSCRKGP